jgi:hypothetical protein
MTDRGQAVPIKRSTITEFDIARRSSGKLWADFELSSKSLGDFDLHVELEDSGPRSLIALMEVIGVNSLSRVEGRPVRLLVLMEDEYEFRVIRILAAKAEQDFQVRVAA